MEMNICKSLPDFRKLSFEYCFIISLFFLIPLSLNAQNPNWQWALSEGGLNGEVSEGIVSDSNGNIYATGLFSSPSITFGNYTLSNNNSGYANFFLVKYDSVGIVIWAKGALSSYSNAGQNVAVDLNGNIYVTGNFTGSYITFGTITLNKQGVNDDVFIVKYNSSGDVIWAKKGGGNSSDVGLDVFLDAFGNCIIIGQYFSSKCFFGSDTLSNVDTIGTSSDIFIVKYDSLGNILWTQNVGGPGDDIGNSITSDTGGNIYFTGSYNGQFISFGDSILTNTNTPYSDIFIAKCDSSGNVLWTKKAGGIMDEYGVSISTDNNDDIILAGQYESNSIIFGNFNLFDPGGFLVKYDKTGNVLWAKNYSAQTASISSDTNKNIYLTGSFCGSNIIFGNDTLTNSGNWCDVFVSKYSKTGNVIWAIKAGGTERDFAKGITNDNFGNIYVTGGFEDTTITFGSTILTNSLPGSTDFFLAKITENITSDIRKSDGSFLCTLFPNPTSGKFILQVPNIKFQKEIVEVKVFNIMGEKILISEIINLKTELDLSNHPKGIYLVAIMLHGTLFYKKLIIQ